MFPCSTTSHTGEGTRVAFDRQKSGSGSQKVCGILCPVLGRHGPWEEVLPEESLSIIDVVFNTALVDPVTDGLNWPRRANDLGLRKGEDTHPVATAADLVTVTSTRSIALYLHVPTSCN